MKFFVREREDFFRPLTWGRREFFAACLRTIYERVHGANADYSLSLTTDRLRSMLSEVVQSAEFSSLVMDENELQEESAERDEATRAIRVLVRHGWLESYADPVNREKVFRFTRAGKEFAEVLAKLDTSRPKTRQRNMRSARKAIAAFLAEKNVDEMIDAYEFASRVIQDLQEDIENFRERIQALTREAMTQHIAWEDFSDFIEKRFRDYAARLVADSAERHRVAIQEELDQVRVLPPDELARIDEELLLRAPWLQAERKGVSPIFWLAQRVEDMVEAACVLKLPMLREEMGNYVRRFTSLLRQSLSLDHSATSPLGRAMGWLKTQGDGARADLLRELARELAPGNVRLADSAALRLPERGRQAIRGQAYSPVVSEASRLAAAQRRAEAEAFAMPERDVLARLGVHMLGGKVRLSDLPLTTAPDVLAALNAISATRSSEGRKQLTATRTGSPFETAYFEMEDYVIEQLPTRPGRKDM